MELYEALQKRRSVRKFTAEPVSGEMIEALLHAAMSGPSACNTCPWEFYVVTSPDKLTEVRGTTRFSKMESPLAIIVCGNLERSLPRELAEFWVQDCSAATENILLRAVDLGLGTVWCGIYPQERAVNRLKKTLDLAENVIPMNIIFVGHPAEEPEARDQYNESCVHYM